MENKYSIVLNYSEIKLLEKILNKKRDKLENKKPNEEEEIKSINDMLNKIWEAY